MKFPQTLTPHALSTYLRRSVADLNSLTLQGRLLWIVEKICLLVVAVALADLAIRAAIRLEGRWDTFMYHVPFAAIYGGLGVPYDMNDLMREYFRGFPPLPHLVQGILWRIHTVSGLLPYRLEGTMVAGRPCFPDSTACHHPCRGKLR